ncbi:MAG: L,D-transpeptidase, partial [Gammaproteobacteria bacterium]
PMYWAVRVSNNGEFIHANPESTGAQGSANVTHGCINLSTANARQYFDTAIFGDPVEVTNSPTPLTAADGDIYDWTVSWEDWRAMSALHS